MTPARFLGGAHPTTRLDDEGLADGARIPTADFAALVQAAREGERLLAAGDLRAAFEAFRRALLHIPDPLEAWNASGWLLVALAECAIRAGDWKRAYRPMFDAMRCPGTYGNPWAHLRMGQCRLETGDPTRARDDLARALRHGGRTIFDGLDPKYLALAEAPPTS
ncbi:MAG: tetratricopeptide repeat protein [Deltaproteobacteria bacterium]|nr:tetratricopeptide repeat protein [Deltaproteobacteria bacterium]